MNLTHWKQKFRGPLSSALLNGAFEEIYRELGVAINHLQQLSGSKNALLSALAYQLQAVNSLYAGTASEVGIMNTTRGILHRNMYTSDGLTAEAGSRIASVSNMYGIAMLPIGRKLSFIPQIVDSFGESIADPSIKLYLDDEFQDADNAVYNMLHHNESSLWFETNSGVDLKSLKLELPKPPTTILNYIEIQPIPNFVQTIDNLEIRNFDGIFASPYDGFPDIQQNSFTSFENNSFNDSIQFELSPWNVDDGVCGIKYFDCGYIDFIGSANLRFELTTTSTINQITDIFHTPRNREFVNPGASYLGFVDDPSVVITIRSGSHGGAVLWDNLSHAYPQDSNIPISAGGVNTLYVNVDFYKINNSTPIFKDLTVYFI